MIATLIFIAALIAYVIARKKGVSLEKKYARILLIAGILGSVYGMYEWINTTQNEESRIIRPEADEGSRKENFILEHDEEEEPVTIRIPGKAYSEEETEELFRRAAEEIDAEILGENPDADRVSTDLNLIGACCDGAVEVSYTFSPMGAVRSDGTLNRSRLEDGEIVEVKAEMTVGERSELYSFPVRITMPDASTEEGFSYYLNEEIKKMEDPQSPGDEVILPETIGDRRVSWKREYSYRGEEIVILMIGAAIAIILGGKEDERKKKNSEKDQLTRDYPEIVSMLSLYVGAGISVKGAFKRIYDEYVISRDRTGEERSGYEAIGLVCRDIEGGRSEVDAVEKLGVRTDHRSYRKLSLLLSQNMRKGSEGLIASLEKEEQEAFEERKNRAKLLGEQASTKLLLPMMGLLGVVIVILVVPAVMEINI